MVKSYCPKCLEVYTPKSSRYHHTDGAYFGTGFPHMLFMVHPEYRPKRPTSSFVPRLVLIYFIRVFKLYYIHNASKLYILLEINNNNNFIVMATANILFVDCMVSKFIR